MVTSGVQTIDPSSPMEAFGSLQVPDIAPFVAMPGAPRLCRVDTWWAMDHIFCFELTWSVDFWDKGT